MTHTLLGAFKYYNDIFYKQDVQMQISRYINSHYLLISIYVHNNFL